MKKRFREKQIVTALDEGRADGQIGELCRKHGISTATYYTWRQKFGQMTVSEAKRLRQLKAENANS